MTQARLSITRLSGLLRLSYLLAALGCAYGVQLFSDPTNKMAAHPATLGPSESQRSAVIAQGVPETKRTMPTRAWDFTNSIGVNTHFGYTDTLYYQQPDRVINVLRAAGIKHVRDGVIWGWVPPNLFTIQAKLASAGIGADLVAPNPSSSTTIAALSAVLSRQPAVESLEAPNEWDQAGGTSWTTTLKAYLPVLKRVAELVKVPLYGPSLTKGTSYAELGNIGLLIDYNNEHNYWGGRNPETKGWGPPNKETPVHYYGSMEYDIDQSFIVGPQLPLVQTETGYIASDSPSQNIISPDIEAIYEPRLLLHSWNKGIKRTYLYELMDDPSSPKGIGLLHADMTETPSFSALATLLKLLQDENVAGTLTPLTYSLSGKNLETTLFEKGDGSYWIAMWNPACIWDVNTLKALPVSSQLVSLTVAGNRSVRAVYQFDGRGKVINLAAEGSTVILSVGAAVTLVKIT